MKRQIRKKNTTTTATTMTSTHAKITDKLIAEEQTTTDLGNKSWYEHCEELEEGEMLVSNCTLFFRKFIISYFLKQNKIIYFILIFLLKFFLGRFNCYY